MMAYAIQGLYELILIVFITKNQLVVKWVQFNALTPCSTGANMARSRPAHFCAFQKLFCRFCVDDVDVLRISVLPLVLSTVRILLPYSPPMHYRASRMFYRTSPIRTQYIIILKNTFAQLGSLRTQVRWYSLPTYCPILTYVATCHSNKGVTAVSSRLSAHPHQWDA